MTARTRRVGPQCGMSGSAWSGGRSCVAATSLRCVGSLTASLSGSARQHRTGRRPTSQRVRALEAAVRAPCSGSGCPVAEVAGVADDDPEGGNPQAQGVEHQCDEEVAPRLAQRTGSRPPGGGPTSPPWCSPGYCAAWRATTGSLGEPWRYFFIALMFNALSLRIPALGIVIGYPGNRAPGP